MTDARRLSARLRESAKEASEVLKADPMLPPEPDQVTAWASLLSDAARLAEVVENWRDAHEAELRTGPTEPNYPVVFHALNRAVSALLAFDLIGRGGVE